MGFAGSGGGSGQGDGGIFSGSGGDSPAVWGGWGRTGRRRRGDSRALGWRDWAGDRLFARQAGYRKTVLWTNDNLLAARRIYERAGFHLRQEEKHTSFGHNLTSQDWELVLTPSQATE